MESDPLIVIENLSFSYGGQPILENVNLTVEANDFLTLVGPNGGGKTTLIRLLMGILNPTRGKITVFGQTPKQACHLIGYVPQLMRIDDQFPVSAIDVVLMGMLDQKHWGFYSKPQRQQAGAALDRLGLTSQSDFSFSALSGGQKQRVLIARALVTNPQLLVLDEPTAHVDQTTEILFFDVLQEVGRDIAIALVTHDLRFVSKMTKRVACVSQSVHLHQAGDITSDKIEDLFPEKRKVIIHNHN